LRRRAALWGTVPIWEEDGTEEWDPGKEMAEGVREEYTLLAIG
jgi:hypothetical protein